VKEENQTEKREGGREKEKAKRCCRCRCSRCSREREMETEWMSFWWAEEVQL
jgi:hypothetical protein